MAEIYFPFASVDGDRKVGPETYERMLGDMFTAGVFPRGQMLAVSADGAMKVSVAPGSAVVIREDAADGSPRGYLYHNTAAVVLSIGTADGVLGRVDNIVLRWSRPNRSVALLVVAGAPAASPVAPALTKTSDVWEICIARVSVAAGTTEITNAMIADRRETDDCGIVSSLAQLDAASFYAQQTALFDDWFATVQNVLSDDVAGNLAAQILAVQQRTDGVLCEITNKDVVVPASAWTKNTTAMRYEATIADTAIRADTDVDLDIADAQKGVFSIAALRPTAGGVVLYATDAPAETVTFRLIVREVRTNG